MTDWVLLGLRRIAEDGSSESARVRALELVGKELGMFIERPADPWDGDLTKLTDAQLERVTEQLIHQACGGNHEAIQEVTQQLFGAPTVAIEGPFQPLKQEAHPLPFEQNRAAQSNVTQVENKAVPASSTGWRRTIDALFEPVNQPAHSPRSSPIQAKNQAVPASSPGRRRLG